MSAAAVTVTDPEAAYYQAVEEFFVSRRGDPLFLSNADWLLIRKWRQAGTPLRIVLRGIADALDAHAVSWSRNRKVGSLAYCAAEVDAARERWRRALVFDREEGTRVEDALAGFADTLQQATGLGPAGAAAARDLADELRQRAARPQDPAALESWLAAQEKALVERLETDAGPAAVSALEAAVDAELAPYRERMPAHVLSQIRKESVTRRLLESRGLPRLSLLQL
ncbi:MAG TPA: hypothetical protein VMT87_13670 [Vicinamibacteria bacterium]|nr:hypothetical protein [Vicinamibacteria bacterium]